MKISIERRPPNKQGKQSLRLVYQFGSSIDPETGKRIHQRRREHLDLYLFQKPKTPDQRQHNKNVLKLTEAIKAKELLRVQSENRGLKHTTVLNGSFFKYTQKLLDLKKDTLSESTHRLFSISLGHLKDYHAFPDLLFKDITSQFLEGFKIYLQKKRSATDTRKVFSSNTVQAYFSKIRTILNQADREGLLQDNPLKRVKNIRIEKTKREHLTLEEIRVLAQTELHPEVMKRAFLFSCMTGLRRSDIHKMVWSEVHDLGKGHRIVFKQKKTRELQYLDLSSNAYQLLGQRGDPDQLVFKDFRPNSWREKNGGLAWIRRAGITKHISFHCARHTFAVLQLTSGTDIYTVSKLLGHTDVRTTQIYADIIDVKRKEAMNCIPDIF